MSLFKRDEEKPFSYPSIEMRKSSRRSTWFVMVLILVLVIAVIFFLNK